MENETLSPLAFCNKIFSMRIPLPFQIGQKTVFLFLALGMALSASAGELKVGTVNMMKLLSGFHEKKAAEAEEKVELASIEAAYRERVVAIKAVEEELGKKKNEFNDPSLAEKKRKEIAASHQELAATRSVLIKEGEEFLQRQRRSLNQKMVGMINDIRTKVETAVSDYAATLDVNLVFDESGLTSSRTPFLIYSRNTVDLTDAVLKKLNKDAPSPVTVETSGGAKTKGEAPK